MFEHKHDFHSTRGAVQTVRVIMRWLPNNIVLISVQGIQNTMVESTLPIYSRIVIIKSVPLTPRFSAPPVNQNMYFHAILRSIYTLGYLKVNHGGSKTKTYEKEQSI